MIWGRLLGGGRNSIVSPFWAVALEEAGYEVTWSVGGGVRVGVVGGGGAPSHPNKKMWTVGRACGDCRMRGSLTPSPSHNNHPNLSTGFEGRRVRSHVVCWGWGVGG